MTKNEVISLIKELKLEKEIEQAVLSLINDAGEINKQLLDNITSILETEAIFYDESAGILEQMALEYENLANNLETIDKEEATAKITTSSNSAS